MIIIKKIKYMNLALAMQDLILKTNDNELEFISSIDGFMKYLFKYPSKELKIIEKGDISIQDYMLCNDGLPDGYERWL